MIKAVADNATLRFTVGFRKILMSSCETFFPAFIISMTELIPSVNPIPKIIPK